MIRKPKVLKELEEEHSHKVSASPQIYWESMGMLEGFDKCWEAVLPVIKAARRGLYFIPMGQPEYKQLEDALENLRLRF